jgi:hypothetical protein
MISTVAGLLSSAEQGDGGSMQQMAGTEWWWTTLAHLRVLQRTAFPPQCNQRVQARDPTLRH